MKDLHMLPKLRDSWSYLYVEHCRIDRDEKAIALHDERGKVQVPCAQLTLLMIGPGATITHAAVSTLAENGCMAAWCGEQGVRFYAAGMGETRSSANLQVQARLWADPALHLAVVRRLYEMRFVEPVDPGLTLRQIRGKEGIRVREAYAQASRTYGVEWRGRQYNRQSWHSGDPVNRALSAANSCLYGVVHAALVAAGFSPALGFIHVGKMLSFVYDVADLYKLDLTVPIAFRETAQGTEKLESRVRHACRDAFAEKDLLGRIVTDIYAAFSVPATDGRTLFDEDEAAPGGLWGPEGSSEGGVNWSEGEGGDVQ